MKNCITILYSDIKEASRFPKTMSAVVTLALTAIVVCVLELIYLALN